MLAAQVAWLMTLQLDLPPDPFHPAFSPLAEQHWVSSALRFLKEMDLMGKKAKKPPLPLLTERASSARRSASSDEEATKGRSLAGEKSRPGGSAKRSPKLHMQVLLMAWRLAIWWRIHFQGLGRKPAPPFCSGPKRPFRTSCQRPCDSLETMPLSALFPLPVPDALPAERRPRSKRGRAWSSLRLSVPFCAGQRSSHLLARFRDLVSFMHEAGIAEDAYVSESVPRFTHKLRGSSTDRRDIYHQAAVSRESSPTALGASSRSRTLSARRLMRSCRSGPLPFRRAGRDAGDLLRMPSRSILTNPGADFQSCLSLCWLSGA